MDWERRVLTQDGAICAKDALNDRRKAKGLLWKDNADSDVCRAALLDPGASWGLLRQRILHACKSGARYRESGLKLAAFLLPGRPLDEITSVIDRSSRPSAGRMVVSCPERTTDHRFVILGQLPDASHFPGVFVKPRDGRDYWYPQHTHKHNPLKTGSAFCCYAHLGNPNWIWHKKEGDMLEADVRVLALRGAWRRGYERLTSRKLEILLSEIGYSEEIRRYIKREPITLGSMRLSHPGGRHDFRLHHVIDCIAPVTITWTGGWQAYIEVHAGEGDKRLRDGTYASGVSLVLAGKPRGSNEIPLDRAGRYRVRLYPQKWSFVEPPYEWWLDIGQAGAPSTTLRAARRRSSN
jgi:hypothetical protein